jgi:hypothetical protein
VVGLWWQTWICRNPCRHLVSIFFVVVTDGSNGVAVVVVVVVVVTGNPEFTLATSSITVSTGAVAASGTSGVDGQAKRNSMTGGCQPKHPLQQLP